MDALEQRVVLNADAVDDSLTTTYQSPVVFSAALLTSNDSGNGALTVTLPSSTIGGGTLSDDGNGNYTYTPIAGFSGTDSFTYTLNDEDPSADAATVSIQVGAPPTNTSPHADNAVFELRVPYGSGGGYYDLSGYIPQQGTHYGDSDGDGLTLTYGGYGWTYVSPGQQYSSSYSIDDGRGGSASATVFINIVEDYAPPSIPGGPYAIGEDTTLSLQTTNPSGKPLSLSVVSGPSHGSLALDAAGQIIYTPEANYFGTDSFYCSVSDGQRTSSTESVTVEIQSVDDAPAATSDAFTVPEDGSVSFTAGDLIGNDSDAESSVTFVRIVQSPTNGTLAEWGSGNSTQFAYTPAANYCGGDSFIYEIVDGTGNLAQATAWINVTPVNDSPVAVGDDAGTMSEDGSLVVRPSDWLVNDSDDEGVPTLLNVSATTGTLVANGDGSYTFTPPESVTGTTSLIYTIVDSQGLTGSAAVTITVTPVNDAPTATGGAQAITEGSSLTLSSYDVDGDALLSAQVTLGPSYGNVSFSDGTLTYTPSDLDFFGSDAFEYAVFDSQEWSSTVHVDVTVAPVNDAPTISVPTAQQLTTTGGMLFFSVAGDNSLAVGDVETGTKRLALAVDRGQLSYGGGTPAQSLIISGDVAQLNAALEGLRFHAPANYAGPAALTISIDDQDATGGGPLTAAATVSLRVQPTISIADATNSETAGALEFTVTLSQACDQDVTVAWQTQPDTADAADFTPASGTLTIAAGQTTGTITVALTNDDRDEDDQTFQLHLSNAVNGGLADAAAIGLIHDDEDAPLVYVVSREVREADGTAQVVVRLSNPSEKPVQVEWHPYDGSAIRGTDGNIYDWTRGNWTPPYSQQEYLDQGGYQDVWMESTGWHPVWIPDQYGDVWVDTSHYGDVLVSSGYWNYNVWVDTSHYGDVWVDTSHWGDVWVPNLVNEPILIDDQLDEYGNVITPGYWQDNWVDHGSYQYQLITEGHNEWQWITEGHYEDQWVDTSHYEYQWITEGHFENQVVIPAHTESQWTTIGWYQQQWVSNWQWTTVGYAGYWTDGGVLNFAPGVTEQAAEVTIVDDAEQEESEYFNVSAVSAQNATLGAGAQATVTIRPSDQAPEFVNIPASYAATVQTALGLHNTGLRIDDVDGDDGALQLTLSVALGRLDVVVGTTGATAQGSGTADVVLSGTLAQVNRLLAGFSDSSLTYTYFGDELPLSDSLMLTAIDSGDGNGAVFTSSASTSIAISADPLPPAISTIADVTIDEDGASAPIAFVLSDATTPAEDLVLAVTSDDETLIPAENIVVTGTGAQRFLTITPAADRFGGPVTITLAVSDGEHLGRRTFQVHVTPVNDAPTFTLETYAEATLDSGPVSIADFAHEISAGPFEASQTLNFTLTSDNPELFTSDGQPTLVIDPQTGHATLTFTPQYAGGAQVTATIHDDGGTANGGQNSTTKTFWIEVVPNFYIAGGPDGGGNSGGSGYNWTPDLGVYYAVAVERPAELKVDVEETLELTDENRLRVGGNLPENAVVRVALRTPLGTLEFGADDPDADNVRVITGTVAQVNQRLATLRLTAGEVIGEGTLSVRVTGPAIGGATRPAALQVIPIEIIAAPEWTVPEEVEEVEESAAAFDIELKHIKNPDHGVITVDWGDETTEVFSTAEFSGTQEDAIAATLHHVYRDAGEFTVTWTFSDGVDDLNGETSATIEQLVPRIVFGGGTSDFQHLLDGIEQLPSPEGARGVIAGRIINLPILGEDAALSNYKLTLSIGGEMKTAELNEKFEFGCAFSYSDDKPWGESDTLEVVVKVEIEGEDTIEARTEIALANLQPTVGWSLPEFTVQEAYPGGADIDYAALRQWVMDHVQPTELEDVNPQYDAPRILDWSVNEITWDYTYNSEDDSYEENPDIAFGDVGDILLKVNVTDDDGEPVSKVFKIDLPTLPERYREQTLSETSTLSGAYSFDDGAPSTGDVTSAVASHFADHGGLPDTDAVDLIDGSPQNQVNVLGAVPSSLNASYLAAGTTNFYDVEKIVRITDLFDDSYSDDQRLDSTQTLTDATYDSVAVTLAVEVVAGPLHADEFTLSESGALSYHQSPTKVNGIDTYDDDFITYRIVARSSAIAPPVTGPGQSPDNGDYGIVIGTGRIDLKTGVVGYSVTASALDDKTGEPLRIAKDYSADDYAIVRFSRSKLPSLDGSNLTSQSGETTIRFHFAAPPEESVDDERKRGDGSDVTVVSGATSDEQSGSSDSGPKYYEAEITAGNDYVDVKIKGVDDDEIELDERLRVVIDSIEGTQELNGKRVLARVEGGAEITVFDNDAVVAYSSQNVDTESTGLTRETVFDGGVNVDLFDGRKSWDSPIMPEYIATYQYGYADGGYVTYHALDAEGEDLGVRILRADGAVVDADDSTNFDHGTLRSGQIGVGDHNVKSLVLAHNPNPTTIYNDGFFGYVDQLVPVYTNGVNPLQGLLLARRDGTSAFFYGVLADNAATEQAELVDAPTLAEGKQWSATFTDLDADRYYTVKDAATGATLGVFRADEDGDLEIRQAAIRMTVTDDDEDYLTRDFADPLIKRFNAFAFEGFVTPDGTFGTFEAAQASDNADGGEAIPDDEDARVYVLKIDGGNTYEFDADGYLTYEKDRQGNRTEYTYDRSVDAFVVGALGGDGRPAFTQATKARLTDVTLQGDLQIHLAYDPHGYHLLKSVTDPFNRKITLDGNELLTDDPGDVGLQSQRLSAKIGAQFAADDAAKSPTTIAGEIQYFLSDSNFQTPDQQPRKAPTGEIGREVPSDAEESDREIVATQRLERLASDVVSTWTYQFDRFGLITAKAATITPTNPEQDVWKWERDLSTGLVTKTYTPAGRGENEGLDNDASDGYDVTEYHYGPEGSDPTSADLRKIVYADGTAEVWTYDADTHQVLTYTDRNEQTTTYHMFEDDGADHMKGDVEYVEDPLGKKTYFTYTGRATSVADQIAGLITSTRDPSNRYVKTEYYGPADGPNHAKHVGLVKKVTYAESQAALTQAGKYSVEEFFYDAYGNVVRQIDATGVVTVSQYDKLGQLLERRLGGEILSTGRLDSTKGVLLGKFLYDSAGNLKSSEAPNAAGNAAFTTAYEYDDRNRLIKVIAPKVAQPKAAGQAEADQDEDGPTTTYAYTADGLLLSTTTADELKVSTTYDARRQAFQTDVVGNGVGLVRRDTENTSFTATSTKATYDSVGNLKTSTDELGRVTDYAYDADGRLIRTRTPDPDGSGPLDRLTTTYRYDAAGNLLETITPNPDTRDGQPATVSELRFYDAAGRLQRIQQPQVAQPQGDGPQRLPLAQFLTYQYNADGSLYAERSGITTALPTDSSTLSTTDGSATGDTLFLETKYTYDYLGRVLTVAVDDTTNNDPAIVTSTAYAFEGTGADKHLVRTDTDAKQNVITTTYDALGRVIRVQLPTPGENGPDGNPLPAPVITRSYDMSGRLEKEVQTYVGNETGSGNRETAYTYDASGNVRTATSAGVKTTYVYDDMGRLTEAHKSDGSYTKTIYNNRGKVVRMEVYDPHAAVALLATTSVTYNEVGDQTSTTLDSRKKTTYQYDALHRVVSQQDINLFGGEDPMATVTTKYNRAGLVSESGTNILQAKYTYDASGRALSQSVVGDGNTTVINYEYDDSARRRTVTDPGDSSTYFTYDGLGRTIKEELKGVEGSRSYQYDALGNIERYTDRDGRTTVFAFDNLGRKKSEQWLNAPTAYLATYVYNAFGDLAKASDPNSSYAYSYNALGQLDKANFDTQYADLKGTGEADITYSYTYKLRARDQVTIAPGREASAGTKVRYSYDALGRITKIDDDSTAFSSAAGTLAAPKFTVDFGYVPGNGTQAGVNITRRRDGNPLMVQTQIDDRGSSYSISHTSDGNGAFSTHFVYSFDKYGRVVTLDGPEGIRSFDYDAKNQLKSSTSDATSQNYKYDAAGNREEAETLPGNRIRAITVGEVGFEYEYDNEGNRALTRTFASPQLTDGDNTSRVSFSGSDIWNWEDIESSDAVGGSLTYAEDQTEHVDVQLLKGDSAPLSGAVYRVFAVFPKPNDLMRTDDALYEVLVNGQRLPNGQGVWHVNQRMSRNDSNYQGKSWTLLGTITLPEDATSDNVVLRVSNADPTGGVLVFDAVLADRLAQTTEYKYDYHNRLTDVVERGPNGGLIWQVNYGYDVFDRRIIRDETSSGTASREFYAYDGDNLALKYVGTTDGQLQLAQRLWWSGTDQLLAVQDAETEQFVWALNDRQGTVVDLIAENSHNDGFRNLQHRKYNPYGTYTAVNFVAAEVVPHVSVAYTGRDFDARTWLYDYRSRNYDPGIGSFTQEDGIGIAADLNRYRYVGNSPTNATDPTGHWALVDDAFAIVGGAAFGLAGQAMGDFFSGKLSSWEMYVGAAVGGAAAGETMLYTANPWLAGAAAGAAGNAATQGLELLSGKRQEFSTAEFGISAGMGLALGGIGAGMGTGANAAVNRSLGVNLSQPLACNASLANQMGRVTAKLAVGAGSDMATDAAAQGIGIATGLQDGWDWNRFYAAGAQGGAMALGQAAYSRACFRAGTPLVWEYGHKQVEELQVGDRLAARSEFDPEGAIEWKAIEEVFVRRGLILEVTVAGQTIGTTAEHPFYLHGKGWTPAGDLAVGDLLAASDGRWLPVENIYNTGALETVYNFRIAEHHTYFVGDQDWGFGVWVHNAKCVGKHLGASEKGFSGIRLTNNGGPDFARSKYLYNARSGQKSIVTITLTGSRRADYRAANQLAGFKGSKAPRGYRWHHVDDFDSSDGTATMQLVKRLAHQATLPHKGSVAQYEAFHETRYRR